MRGERSDLGVWVIEAFELEDRAGPPIYFTTAPNKRDALQVLSMGLNGSLPYRQLPKDVELRIRHSRVRP